MKTIILIIAYDGSGFSGWQRQDGATTIQGTLEDAITRINHKPTVLRGASRTDAGVHAEYQIAAFDTERDYTPRRWIQAINATTPPQIFIRQALEGPLGYEPRFESRGKHYRYAIYEGAFLPPALLNRAAHSRRLDIDNMQAAAQFLLGEHDFSAFRAADCQAKSPVRTITSIEITRQNQTFSYETDNDGALVLIDVKGTAFLKQMVRIIAGTLIEFGLGRPFQEMKTILDSRKRCMAGETAPAAGLTLIRSWSAFDDDLAPQSSSHFSPKRP